MSDKQLIIQSNLEDIKISLELILKRFSNINSADDFLSNDDNLEKLDSISMRLIAIGEALKKIDKLTNNQLLLKYPNMEWKKIKGVRDVLSHHYFDLDAEIIFKICENQILELLETIVLILKEKKYEII